MFTNPKNEKIEISTEERESLERTIEIFSRPAAESYCHVCKGTGDNEHVGQRRIVPHCRACLGGDGWQIYSDTYKIVPNIKRILNRIDGYVEA